MRLHEPIASSLRHRQVQSVNANYGHHAVDSVLKICALLNSEALESPVCAIWREEFLLILSRTCSISAVTFAESLRRRWRVIHFQIRADAPPPMSCFCCLAHPGQGSGSAVEGGRDASMWRKRPGDPRVRSTA